MFKKRGEVKEYTGFFGRYRALIATTTLIGTIVGAGILAIPYVVAKAGFLYGAFLIISLGIVLMFVNLFMGEVVLRTKQQHQLTGYAEKYLGKNGKKIMAFSLLFLIYGALTAYLIGEGESLFQIFKGIFECGLTEQGDSLLWGFVCSPLLYSLLFFLVTFIIIYQGVKATGKAELFLISALLVIIALVGIFSFDQISWSNFTGTNWAYFFLPYGVIFFALHGTAAVPELQEVLGKEKKQMKKVIVWGSVIPIILYIVFCFFIIGIIGLQNFELLQPNERIATIALSFYSSPILGFLANMIAVLAMFTSYLTLGIALLEVYEYDYHLSKVKAFFLVFSVPLLVVFFNLTSFITIIGMTGAIAGGLDGILITLMYWKAKQLGNRKPEYSLNLPRIVGLMVIVFFSLGIAYQLWAIFFKSL